MACGLVCAAAFMACGDDALEEVRVCGALVVPDELVAVRVSTLDERLVELAAGVTELVVGESTRQLPIVVSLPLETGRHVVRAQAIGEDGAEVARADVLVGAESDLGTIIVNLSRECMGQVCALGQTCVGGDCTVIPDAGASALCETGEASP